MATLNIGEKIWGTTYPLVLDQTFEMHRLRIKPWHRCSEHLHQFKHNAFYVLAGVLFVDTWLDGRHEEKILGPGEHYTVAPGVRHQFRTGPIDCVCLEMYYPDPGGPVLSEDIHRFNEGAPCP